MRRRSLLQWLAAGNSGLIGGCCQFQHAMKAPSLDYFQRYLIIGFGPRPCCPLPVPMSGEGGLTTKGYEIALGEQLEFWLRAVQVEATYLPSPLEAYEQNIQLDVIDALGAISGDAGISPPVARTSADGFSNAPLKFIPNTYGVFRIQARYPDRNTFSRSLSTYIIVRS